MAAPPPSTVTLRAPSIYQSQPTPDSSTSPPLEWLMRTWTVTHSTLAMWRHSRNVRITYKPLPEKTPGHFRIDDLVENEPLDPAKRKNPLRVAGVDTARIPGDAGYWDWRGKGWLFFVTSHWEVLGWGERPVGGASGAESNPQVERWAVTWFQKTWFTAEGVDIYCDRSEGLTLETYALITDALKGLTGGNVAALVEKDMLPVALGSNP